MAPSPARSERGRAAALLALLALADAPVVLAFVRGWWVEGLLLHIIVCLAVPLGWRFAPPASGWPGATLRMSSALLPALGLLAPAGGLLALLLGPPRRRRPGGPPLADPLTERLQAVRAAGQLPAGLRLEALGDVLRWGGPAQQAQALELAAERPEAEAAVLLRLALTDADPGLRGLATYQAATAGQRLRASLAARREASAGGGSRVRAALLDRAAGSLLLDAAGAAACRAEAAALWRALAETLPDDAEAAAALGEDLLALGDLAAARAAFEAALARGGATPALLAALAGCLLRLRDLAALDALVAWHGPAAVATGEGAAAWAFWHAATAPGMPTG